MVHGMRGELTTHPSALDQAAADFGRIYHRRPRAVLKPACTDDIVRLIRFARRTGTRIAARGRGHSTGGQAQVPDGFVVDMASLCRVVGTGANWIEVEAGADWRCVLAHSLRRGLMPPVLPDYLGLTVGGTLSVGGLGHQSARYGAVVDSVERVLVATGKGEVVSCSNTQNEDLFDACLGGLGQFGFIVRARLRLSPAPDSIRLRRFAFRDCASFLLELERLAYAEKIDTLQGLVVANTPPRLHKLFGEKAARWRTSEPRWVFAVQSGQYVFSGRGSGAPSSEVSEGAVPLSYVEGDLAIDRYLDSTEQASPTRGTPEFRQSPHPWMDLMIPSNSAVKFLSHVLDDLRVEDMGNGPILVYPLVRGQVGRSNMALPSEGTFFLVDLLRNSPEHGPTLSEMLAQNRRFYDAGVAMGGLTYPIGSLRLTPARLAAPAGVALERIHRRQAAVRS